MAQRSVAELLAASADDESAWDELVSRYCRLVWSVARSFRLDDAATADVTQAVWLRLVENARRIREPERLAAWLATTTRNEAMLVLRQQGRQQPTEDIGDEPDRAAGAPEDVVVDLIEDDRLHRELYAAFERLGHDCQRLLRLLTADPALDYATISWLIDRPIGSIGPTRARCLERLRAAMEAQAR